MNDLIDSGPGSLDGLHNFHQFNPAIGLSYNGFDNLTLKPVTVNHQGRQVLLN